MRIIHFVTGGFSGSTNVAKEIIQATNEQSEITSLLVLNKKKSTTTQKIKSVRESGVNVKIVSGYLRLVTIYQLYKICKKFKPDILVVHGFSEHLWGRYAGLLAKVPHMIHVEHNSQEPYTWLRLKQAKWLATYTDAIVGCSEGVRNSLVNLGFSADKTLAINNGIKLQPFEFTKRLVFSQRKPEIIMAARFAKQKDHISLIEAIDILKIRGFTVKVSFAGTGNKLHLNKVQKLVIDKRLNEQVTFLGHCENLPERLSQVKLFVLSTHYEGMPLALIEAMASGCVVIGSEVTGVKEMIEHGKDGYLVSPESPEALANAIQHLLTHTSLAESMALKGQQKAFEHFSINQMATNYKSLFLSVMSEG